MSGRAGGGRGAGEVPQLHGREDAGCAGGADVLGGPGAGAAGGAGGRGEGAGGDGLEGMEGMGEAREEARGVLRRLVAVMGRAAEVRWAIEDCLSLMGERDP